MARPQAADYEDRRQAIIDKAADLFAAKGFLGTSIQDIARACGASKSLLYHYFSSKEDVLQAVMASHVDRLVEHVEAVAALKLDPDAQLQQVLSRFMDEYVGAASRQKVLLDELVNLPEAQRTRIISQQRKIVDAVQSMLVAMHPSLADDHSRARAMTMLLFGMINWTGNWYDPTGAIPPDEIAALVFGLMAASNGQTS